MERKAAHLSKMALMSCLSTDPALPVSKPLTRRRSRSTRSRDRRQPQVANAPINGTSAEQCPCPHSQDVCSDTLALYFPFGSRFAAISSGVTLELIPESGTLPFAVHKIALSISLRWSSFAQPEWKCPPVNPKPRPPSGRSTAQATVWGRGRSARARPRSLKPPAGSACALCLRNGCGRRSCQCSDKRMD